MNIVSTCLGFFGMIIGWYLMSFVGRRTMLVTGLGMQSIVTFTLGFMSLASHTKFLQCFACSISRPTNDMD